ncbi:MAG: PEGA domain-containing protein [Sideroxydans sp.]|nr:PEGA domain-containing protein [Sideroxydans sp.]
MLKFRSLILIVMLSVTVVGCASHLASVVEQGNELIIREDAKPGPNARPEKYQIKVRVADYTDARQIENPRLVGMSDARISGMTGKKIMSDRDAAVLAAESMKKYLSDAGFQVTSGDGEAAQFQLNGAVRELRIDVKGRDYVNIAIESTLTEVTSGKVIWSGMVAEKADRFAGSSGNSKKDVADYLRVKLGVVSGKTTESILAVLMATQPEIFNMAVGLKPVQGVTVFSNSSGGGSAIQAVSQTETAHSNGTISIKSNPSRAKVYVDGIYFGLTPLRAEYAAGIHDVGVKMDGYKDSNERLSVRKGDNTELEVNLQH